MHYRKRNLIEVDHWGLTDGVSTRRERWERHANLRYRQSGRGVEGGLIYSGQLEEMPHLREKGTEKGKSPITNKRQKKNWSGRDPLQGGVLQGKHSYKPEAARAL